MPNYNAQNIELGEGLLYVKGASDVDYVNVGGSQGAELQYTPEFKDISIGQAFSAVKTVLIGEECRFRITLAESSMRNLALACGLDPSADVDSAVSGRQKIILGAQDIQPNFLLARYEVSQIDDSTKKFIITINKVLFKSGFSLPFQKDAERVFEVEAQLYPDLSSGQLGDIVKEV